MIQAVKDSGECRTSEPIDANLLFQAASSQAALSAAGSPTSNSSKSTNGQGNATITLSFKWRAQVSGRMGGPRELSCRRM